MYPELQEQIAQQFFGAFFDQNIQVAELRTQLGISGMEMKGPELAAHELLEVIKKKVAGKS